MGSSKRGARWQWGAAEATSAQHRKTAGHPFHHHCRSEPIQGHQVRICKCGGQGYRHGEQGGRNLVVTGVGVSNALLDVVIGEGSRASLRKQRSGPPPLVQRMDRAGATQAVCKATGGYDRLLVSRLRATGTVMPVAHPLRVRAKARTRGYEAKTDALDARVLARYGQVFPASDTCPSESEEERMELPHGCGSVGNRSLSGSRNGTCWTRASILSSVGPSGGT